MVGGEYVGGCTVTFMALQVRGGGDDGGDVMMVMMMVMGMVVVLMMIIIIIIIVIVIIIIMTTTTLFPHVPPPSTQTLLHMGCSRCVIIGMDHSSLPQHTHASGGLAAAADANHFDANYVSPKPAQTLHVLLAPNPPISVPNRTPHLSCFSLLLSRPAFCNTCCPPAGRRRAALLRARSADGGGLVSAAVCVGGGGGLVSAATLSVLRVRCELCFAGTALGLIVCGWIGTMWLGALGRIWAAK